MPHLKSSVLSSAEQVAKLLRGKLTEMVPVPEDVRSAVLKNFARKPYGVAIAESYAEHLNVPDLDQLRRALVRLVQVTPVRSSTVVDVSCPGFLSDLSSDEELATLQRAKEHNLVIFSKDAAGCDTVELSDERLILGWPRLAEWINSDRDFLAWLPEVTNARRTWIDSGMEPDDLLSGTKLAQAVRWLQTRRNDLRTGEIDFIEQCQASDEALRAAAEVEIKNVGLQRKVQTLQSHRDREELEAKGRELEEANAAYKQLSDSVRTSGEDNRWVLTKAITAILVSLAVAFFVWQKYEYAPKPASPVSLPSIVPRPDPSSPDPTAASDIPGNYVLGNVVTITIHIASTRDRQDAKKAAAVLAAHGYVVKGIASESLDQAPHETTVRFFQDDKSTVSTGNALVKLLQTMGFIVRTEFDDEFVGKTTIPDAGTFELYLGSTLQDQQVGVLLTSFSVDVPSGIYKAGREGTYDWMASASGSWVENRNGKYVNTFEFHGRTKLDGCNGGIFQKVGSTSEKVFVPDTDCPTMVLKYSSNQVWQAVAQMKIDPTSHSLQ